MLRTGWISGAMRCHELGCGTRVPSWLLRPAAEEAAAARSCCFRLMVSKASRACEETEAAGVWVAGVDGGSGWRKSVAEVGGGARARGGGRRTIWRRRCVHCGLGASASHCGRTLSNAIFASGWEVAPGCISFISLW